MSEPSSSTCATCGYSWPTGRDGSHACASVLGQKVEALEAENARLKASPLFGVLRLEPGDILVVRHTGRLSERDLTALREQIKEVRRKLGYEGEVLVLEQGMTVGAVRPPESAT